MKKRWKLLSIAGGLIAASILAPLSYIEGTCGSPIAGFTPTARTPILPAPDRRAEARTWLTYPEWHIVYSADALGRHLASGRPPSGYPYLSDIGGFWKSYCTLNRVTANLADAGDAKVMIYTIGISFTWELGIKALYENTVGRLAEGLSGWTSADDRYAARVQQLYGHFMHETPWYAFPFGTALVAEWRTSEPNLFLRHWERRLALSAEYGVKTGYAKLIGAASGATLGRDQLTLRFVTIGDPSSVDPRLRRVRALPAGRFVIEAPRYAQLTELLLKLSETSTRIVEIAGNDDVFVTVLAPDKTLIEGTRLLDMKLGDRPGWRRVGVSVKAHEVLPVIRHSRAAGASIEHVYDY